MFKYILFIDSVPDIICRLYNVNYLHISGNKS